MKNRVDQLNQLTLINIQDLLVSTGLENARIGRRIIEWLFRFPAQLFARQMVQYDQSVGEQNLQDASREMLRSFINSLEIIGQENIPSSGPVLILSNHPGMTDTLALFTSISRPDLRIVAAERPFLQSLPNMATRLINVPEDPSHRMSVVRSVVSHLRQGGAILTFPAGKIEPDPAVMPGAIESLKDWSESISLFTRLVPTTQTVVSIVSGVIWDATLRQPIIRLRREQKDRERMAAALQLLVLTLRPELRPNRVRVVFSEPISAGDPLVQSASSTFTRLITEQAKIMIENSTRQEAQSQSPGQAHAIALSGKPWRT
jgi:1-acyl-sn-glycerol-3-phosphate acyltransferase